MARISLFIIGLLFSFIHPFDASGARYPYTINTSKVATPVQPPTAKTDIATLITITTATLNGGGNPRNNATTGWFRYSTTNPGVANDAFGTRAPAAGGSNLGAGSSLVSYAQGITGLTSGTTYYYCAITQNIDGTAFGSIQSFTTASAPPTATTVSTSSRTGTSATLNGSGNPNGFATTGWFRYSTVSPGTGNNSFGTRAPASGGSDLGAGIATVAYSQGIAGLIPGTTYYYCAITENTQGMAFGALQSFTTPLPPTATTNSASSITQTTATLNGNGTPNGAATTGWFRYSTTNPGVANDVFGTRAPTSGGSSLGAGYSSQAYTQAITDLIPGTTYYYCAITQNAEGTAFGSIQTFTTSSAPPTAITNSATSLTGTSATLNGSGNPNGFATTGWFRYSTVSPGTGNNSFGIRAPASDGANLGAGVSTVPYSQGIAGLIPGTTYFYCAITENAQGMAFGAIQTFTTPLPPTATTNSASSITQTTATLNGTGTPNGAATTGWFRYSTTNPGAANDVFGTRAPTSGGTALGAGYSAQAFTQAITDLIPGTTYYYCAITQSAEGTAFGAVQSFTTSSAPPTATTVSTSSRTGTSATLNGSGNPNGFATTGWFRYSTVSPGTGNNSFGTRAPASGGSDLGAGIATVAYSQGIAGLIPGTTYYYCAITENTQGMAFGALQSFTTPLPPTATTNSASSITQTTATLNGTGTPNGAATTGWFRYSTTNPGAANDVFGTRAPTSGGTALGSGYAAQAFAESISGLSPATTYYYCAITQNAEGTAFGSIQTFTTSSAPPTATTVSTSSRTGTSATLNGSGNPNGFTTTGWFRYSTVSPGTGNNSFGIRAPASDGANLGAGVSTVPYSQGIAGLIPGTTYFYCAITENAQGMSFGAIQTFTTPLPPTATTNSASSITQTTATLNGTGTPNGEATTGWFRYSTTNPGVANDVFGTRAPTSGGSSLGSGYAAQAFAESISGLSPATTYYYCAITQNAEGTAFGSIQTFTTSSAPPTAITNSATSLTGTSATLNGSGNPNGFTTTGWFRYSTVSPGTGNNSFGIRAPASDGANLGAGVSTVPYSQGIAGLIPGTTYFYCAITENAQGMSFGAIQTFTTPLPPTATTNSASSITQTTATLNGTGTPNGEATTGWFRYSTTNPGVANDVFGTRAPTSGGSSLGSGYAAQAFAESISGLSPATTYYYCAITQNAEGTAFGSIQSFTTSSAPPTATTNSATSLTGTSATLNGSGNPNGFTTTGWFRYSTVSPGTGNNSFGIRAPASDGANLGAGVSTVPYSQGIAGLIPGTTYFYCAITENAQGMSFGAIQSFITADTLYTFTGAGNWDDPTNWMDMKIPPAVLPSYAQIIIEPAGNKECILNVTQTILPGAKITVMPGKKFRIPGELNIQ